LANRKDISDKERALIERARRELAKRAAPEATRAGIATAVRPLGMAARYAPPAVKAVAAPTLTPVTPIKASAPDIPVTGSGKGADHAARVAALIAAEHEETERQRRRMRRWGIHVPLAVFAIAVLWLVILLLRRPWG
jgi:hypothetical protein